VPWVKSSVGTEKVPLSKLSAYPNPVTDMLNLTGLTPGNVLKLYDSSGMLLSTYTVQGETMTINLSHLNSGIYFLNTEGNALKIIKK
jgi:hypothetical protein